MLLQATEIIMFKESLIWLLGLNEKGPTGMLLDKLAKEINALKNYKKKCIVAETTSRCIKDELDQIDFLIRCGVKDCDLIDVSPILNRSQT